MPSQHPFRVAALVAAAALVSVVFAPLVAVPTASAAPTAPSNETLRNPSLEGSAGEASGFELFYAATTSPIAGSGSQSVNLAPGGATPQPWSALGLVKAFTTHPVLLSQLTGISYRQSVPSTPPSELKLQVFFGLDLDQDGDRDQCLLGGQLPVTSAPGWSRMSFDASAPVLVADGDCGAVSASRTIADLQADAAYSDATVTSISLQSVVATSDPWPATAPVYVDDLSLAATSGHLVRIADALDNVCGGASFMRVTDALACATDGATLLLGPGVIAGGFTLSKPVTLCGAPFMAPACADGADEIVVSGGGATVVSVTADDVTLRGFAIENGAYSASGAVSPTLLSIAADRVHAIDLDLREPAAPLALGQTRTATRGVLVQAGSEDVLLERVGIERMPSSRGPTASCALNACMSVGIDARGAGIERLRVVGGWIDMGGSHPSWGFVGGTNGTTLEWNTILTAGGSGTTSAGIVGAIQGLADWTLRFNYIQSGDSEPAQTAVGIAGAFVAPWIEENTLRLQSRGIILMAGSRDAHVEGNLLIENDVGLLNQGPRTEVKRNSFQQNGASIVLAGNGAYTGSSAGFRAHNSTFLGDALLFRVQPEVPAGTAVDARFNTWGVYSRAEIRGKMEGGAATIDESCYIDADQQTPVCPPIADFLWSPSPALWNREVQLLSTSRAPGRAIATYEWDFGDGEPVEVRDPAHTFASPGDHPVTLTVTDVEGYSHSITKPVAVVNTAPVLAPVGPRTVAEGAQLTIVLSAVDAEGDALAYSASGLPDGATFDAANRTFSWSPSYTQEGAHSVAFAVTDSLLGDEELVAISVGHANAVPLIAIEGTTAGREMEELSFLVRGSDVDGDAVRLNMFVLPQGASFVDHANGTGTFRWTPSYLQAGRYPINVQAADALGSSQIGIFLDVWEKDRAPVWPSIPAKSVNETQKLQFFVSASDPDGDQITYSAVALPTGAKFTPAERRFEWTPTIEQQGVHRATLRASDGNLSTDVIVTINVIQLNRAPVAGANADQLAKANRTLTFSLSGSDADRDTLAFTIVDAPEGLVVDGRDVTWRPTHDQVGDHALTVVVTDVAGANDTGIVNVTVLPNLAPVVNLVAPPHVDVGANARFLATGSIDPDGTGALKYGWDFNDSDGLTTQRSTETADWIFPRPGLYNVTLRVTDQDGLVTTQVLTVDVDDGIRLFVFVVEDDPNPARSKMGGAYVTDWEGRPISGQDVEVWGTYSRVRGHEPELWRATVRTGKNGMTFFVIPGDGVLAYVPGAHTLYGHTELRETYQGNTEVAHANVVYGDHLV